VNGEYIAKARTLDRLGLKKKDPADFFLLIFCFKIVRISIFNSISVKITSARTARSAK